MTAATDTLRGALDRQGVPDRPAGEHDAPNSATRSLREDEDLRLIARVAAKDQQAFTLLYQRYAPRLKRFLSKSLRGDALANEAVNDTMLVVWRKASRFDPDRARVSTWLFGIAHHAGLKALARSAKEACAPLPIGEERDREEPEGTHDPATTVLGWELGHELMAAVQQLSPHHRAVIELTFVEGFFVPADREHRGLPGKYRENQDVPCPPTAGTAPITSRVGRRTSVRVVRAGGTSASCFGVIEPFVSNKVMTSRGTRTAATKVALRSLFTQSGAMRSPRTLLTVLSTEISSVRQVS